MIKLALIPPISRLVDCTNLNYHLLLPQLVWRYPFYEQFYQNIAMDYDNYLILDNGAAEGEMIDGESLLRTAVNMDVDEVVIPDVIADPVGSQWALEAWLVFLDRINYQANTFKFMAVAQGTDFESTRRYIHDVLMHDTTSLMINTIGLPRHLLKTCKDIGARLKLATEIYQVYGADAPEIHFLGASPLWTSELEFACEEVPFVRGMDTSMPYVYGMQHCRVPSSNILHRQSGYFDFDASVAYAGTETAWWFENNVKTMLNWTQRGIVG